MSYCSPDRHSTSTCLTMKELRLIATDYNKTNPTNKIKFAKTKNELYATIREKLAKYCEKNESHCWIDQPFISSEHKNQLQNFFRPKKPQAWYKNPRTWLNTFDILDVMRQYEKYYKNFSFLGVYPIDFRSRYSSGECIGDNICTFDIKNILENKKDKFSIVLNLDKHNQSGSHWVSLYANLNPKLPNFGIYYYDSVASSPGREVREFMNEIKKQIIDYYDIEIAKKFIIKYNKIQKQFKGTECGIFSIVILTQLLKDYDFNYICEHMHRDDKINSIRDILYRP